MLESWRSGSATRGVASECRAGVEGIFGSSRFFVLVSPSDLS